MVAPAGRPDRAIESFEEALTIRRELGDRPGEVMLLNNLGAMFKQQGRPDRAIGVHEPARAMAVETGDVSGAVEALSGLAMACHKTGRLDDAVRYYLQSLDLSHAIGDRMDQAHQMWELGNVHRDLGRDRLARYHWEQALFLLRQAGALSEEEARAVRGERFEAVRRDSRPWTPAPLSLHAGAPVTRPGPLTVAFRSSAVVG